MANTTNGSPTPAGSHISAIGVHDAEMPTIGLDQQPADHVESRDRSRGMIGLADWLADQIGAASADDQERSQELTRRLESDADAVQVLTIHRCKGLQYPVVYVPFGWDLGRSTTKPQGVVFNDEHEGRLLDVRAPDADGRQESDAAAALEDAGEQLRMLYVALTRAASLLVLTFELWAYHRRW